MNEQNQQFSEEEAKTSHDKTERRLSKKERKRERREAEKLKKKRQKIMHYFLWTLAGAGIVIAFIVAASRREVLPPTTMQGHIERSPESHIVDRPMDSRVHKHMLEHADGSGPPGIIINYNCDDFDCAPDFIDNLAKLVTEYPRTVYLAPYPNMSAKLALSALGRQKVLDVFDEEEIREFIER